MAALDVTRPAPAVAGSGRHAERLSCGEIYSKHIVQSVLPGREAPGGARIELRPYQQEMVERVAASSSRRLLTVAPTGSGKAVVAGKIMSSTDERYLFIAHRRELIEHAAAKLREFGVEEAGIILAGEEVDPEARVQCGSI